MSFVWFNEAASLGAVGGKGLSLCRMSQAGLPVPPGFCITADGIEHLDTGDLQRALNHLNAATVAIRSSAMQEDGDATSFAGIFLTRLNVASSRGVFEAVEEVRTSAWARAAAGYAHRRSVAEARSIAAVVQTFIPADASGVLFTHDPANRSDQIVVEGSWGLGEAVVRGLIKPDRWTFSYDGEIISSTIGDKDIAIVPNDGGGTKHVKVECSRRRQACLSHESLLGLVELARRCEQLFGTPQDIEWAIALNQIWLLQSRPITV